MPKKSNISRQSGDNGAAGLHRVLRGFSILLLFALIVAFIGLLGATVANAWIAVVRRDFFDIGITLFLVVMLMGLNYVIRISTRVVTWELMLDELYEELRQVDSKKGITRAKKVQLRRAILARIKMHKQNAPSDFRPEFSIRPFVKDLIPLFVKLLNKWK